VAVDRLLAAGALRSKDVFPPVVYPTVPFAKPGESVSLSYLILEDSKRASDVLTVFSGSQQLATFRFPLRPAIYTKPHSVSWLVPDPPPPELRYCVRATDASGNRGKESCMPIKFTP
jgi:hypothetical protein